MLDTQAIVGSRAGGALYPQALSPQWGTGIPQLHTGNLNHMTQCWELVCLTWAGGGEPGPMGKAQVEGTACSKALG